MPEFRREETALSTHRAALRERFPLAPASARRNSRLRQLAGGACTLVLLVSATLWIDPAYRTDRFSTVIGERREVTLADDSRVVLNTGSALDAAWHLRSRRLTLRQGEALFDIAHATHRPLTVQANGGSVEVTGTAFNVRLEARGARVTVTEGRVLVRGASATAVLSAGEEIAWSDGQLPGGSTPSDSTRALAWREGKLVFERTPLKTALAEVQRYRAAPIVLHDDGIGDLRLSGVYDVDRTGALLELLPAVLPVRITMRSDGRADVRGAATR